MKNLRAILSLFVVVSVGLLITSCDNKNDNRYDADRSELSMRIDNTIQKIDAKIVDLKNRRDNASEETVENINDRIDKLQDRRDDLKDDLNEMKGTMDDNWESFKSDVDKAIDDTENWISNIDIDINDGDQTVETK